MDLGLDVDIEALRARLPPRPLTRFAPSPTGYLHLGHVVNACLVWAIARALDGRVLLRIEDRDRLRSRAEYEDAILEDLAWLGFCPDIGPVRQSDEPEAYEEALRRLAASHHVYACDCSRREIAAVPAQPAQTGEEVPYSRRCRWRRLAFTPGRGVRVVLSDEEERFLDATLGMVVQTPATQCGDLLVRDRDGFWTYQFSVVVDDCRQGVDLVVRGMDLLASTGRQLQLARMLGRTAAPVFLHHPLLRKQDGEKLSKSSRDTGVRDLRRAGCSAQQVIALARQMTDAQGDVV